MNVATPITSVELAAIRVSNLDPIENYVARTTTKVGSSN